MLGPPRNPSPPVPLPMMLVAALVFAALCGVAGAAVATPAGESSPGGEESASAGAGAQSERDAARAALFTWISERRREAGLPGVEANPALGRVARERAVEVARSGSVDSSPASVSRVSRRIAAAGYRAHRWTERAMIGYRPPVRMVEAWSRAAESSFEQIVLGEYDEVGIGVADAGEGSAVLLLFATPRSSWFRKEVAGLDDLEAVRRQVLVRVNRAREESGLEPVRADPELDVAAQAHAADMRERGYYGHVSPRGEVPRDWVARTDYPPLSFLAENIAKGLFEPAETVNRWLDSRDHRRNILDPRATETGLGVAWGEVEGEGEYQVYWVQLFARPR